MTWLSNIALEQSRLKVVGIAEAPSGPALAPA